MSEDIITKENLNAEDWKIKRDKIYSRAELVDTMDKLKSFYDEMITYPHDYNTICYAVSAMAIAAARVMDRSPVGGITGFQAGGIAWEFWTSWLHKKDEPMRMMYYQYMLYPQYETSFDKVISEDTWLWLQKQAQEKIKETTDKDSVHPDVLKHWESIVNGKVPFGYSVKEVV